MPRPLLAVLLGLHFPVAALALCVESSSPAAPGVLSLWYDKPAAFTKKPSEDMGQYRTLLDEALLIGNGRFGAMVMGGVAKELVRMSENTLWTGGLNPDGSYVHNMGRFQTLGDLTIELAELGASDRYRRSLDLTNAIVEVTYTAHRTTYRREYFVSHPDQVLAIRLTADCPGQYSGALSFTDAHERLAVINKNRITVPGGLDNGLRYETQILLLNVRFSGNRIDLIGRKATDGGTAKVFVDGIAAERLPVFRTTFIQPKRGQRSRTLKGPGPGDVAPHAADLHKNMFEMHS